MYQVCSKLRQGIYYEKELNNRAGATILGTASRLSLFGMCFAKDKAVALLMERGKMRSHFKWHLFALISVSSGKFNVSVVALKIR